MSDNSVSKIKLYSVALIYTFSIGFSFLAIKKCIPFANSLTILTYRYDFALLGVLVWLALCKAMGKLPENKKDRPKSKLYLTAGFYVGFMALQITAMFFATSIEGSIVFAVVPILAKIIARIFLGEKSTLLQNIFVVITVSALIVLIILEATDLSMSFPGLIIMLAASLSMAISNVFMRYVRGTFKPIEITKTIAVGGFVLFNVISIIRAAVTDDFDSLISPITHPQFLIAISFLGIFCILLSAQFMAYMLAHMEIVQSTIFGNASTAISIIAGAVLLGEPLTVYHIICALLILTGVIGLSLAPAPAENSGKKLEPGQEDSEEPRDYHNSDKNL